ncbi:MAG: hypothetical protein Q7V04_05360 [Deltaproteobacteria bacterium]|nr:hypothetical protein [Deltaproteobacteria bacterium]
MKAVVNKKSQKSSSSAAARSRTGSSKPVKYAIEGASGVIETINNIVNMTVVSRDANDLKAEYNAGFVQGKLQGKTIISARDNAWSNSYLLDPSHAFPKQPCPTKAELQKAAGLLNTNYSSFLAWVRDPKNDRSAVFNLKRLLFRMLGIYHGATIDKPASLDFSGVWLPDKKYFKPAELTLGYETGGLSFMDVYFLNAYCDLMDIIADTKETSGTARLEARPREKCSAFLKRVDGEVILTHNTWQGFLSQTMTQTLAVNNDLLTLNAASPGLIGSGTDFGYNNKGIMFNETTHRASTSSTKIEGLWIFWRATLAEQFSHSIDEFFTAISLDNTGTYLNGYMLADAFTRETGLVEMSYNCFVFYKQAPGKDYTVTTSPASGPTPWAVEYDSEMVTRDYLMGINFPASRQVRTDLESTDNRPARRAQLREGLPGVMDVESAKQLITHTDPANPLSLFGRWDLGYGETDYPKQIPDGSIDSKVVSTSMVRAFKDLSGILDTSASSTGFWMLYGTAHVNGEPFIWSRSSWSWQTLRDVPDRVDGVFTLMPLNLR